MKNIKDKIKKKKEKQIMNIFNLLFIIFYLLFISCNDPVFYEVSVSVKIPPPIVSGSPTDFVKFGNYMYVASGNSVHHYNNHNWNKTDLNIGRILYLAKDASYIYALSENGLYRTTTPQIAGSYTPVSIPRPLTMYSDGSNIFIGTEISQNDYAVYNSYGSLIANTGTSLLNGAANNGTTTFVITKNQKESNAGIYYVSGSSLTFLNSSHNYMGIIAVGSNIYTIDRNGHIYSVTTSGVSNAVASTNKLSNGTLFEYNYNGVRLLLAGRLDTLHYTTQSGFTYGYLEATLDSSGQITSTFREPGLHTPTTLVTTSVGDNDRFKSTIGKHPVQFFCLADDGILFASTQLNGVWSLKNRNGQIYWNTEN